MEVASLARKTTSKIEKFSNKSGRTSKVSTYTINIFTCSNYYYNLIP